MLAFFMGLNGPVYVGFGDTPDHRRPPQLPYIQTKKTGPKARFHRRLRDYFGTRIVQVSASIFA